MKINQRNGVLVPGLSGLSNFVLKLLGAPTEPERNLLYLSLLLTVSPKLYFYF